MPTSDYQRVLNEITQEVKPLLSQGKVADYIPALAEVDLEQFSIAIYTTEGRYFARVIVNNVLRSNQFLK